MGASDRHFRQFELALGPVVIYRWFDVEHSIAEIRARRNANCSSEVSSDRGSTTCGVRYLPVAGLDNDAGTLKVARRAADDDGTGVKARNRIISTSLASVCAFADDTRIADGLAQCLLGPTLQTGVLAVAPDAF